MSGRTSQTSINRLRCKIFLCIDETARRVTLIMTCVAKFGVQRVFVRVAAAGKRLGSKAGGRGPSAREVQRKSHNLCRFDCGGGKMQSEPFFSLVKSTFPLCGLRATLLL